MNPFVRSDGDKYIKAQPLNPCSHTDHARFYAHVDNTQSSYNDYESFLSRFGKDPKGHAVLAYGASGCGKSSLVYRCISLIESRKWERDELQFETQLFDFHNENLKNGSAEQKASQINELMAEALEEKPITEQLIEKFLEKLDASDIRALRYLEQEFRRKKILPVIYFPYLETISELDKYLELFLRSNWVLFFESVNPSVLKQCELRYPMSSSNPVKILQLHPLTPKDAIPFLETRLSLLEGDEVINFEPNALERFLRGAMRRPSGGASLKEIEIICGHAFEEAFSANRTSISYANISDVFVSIMPGIS